MFDGSPRDIEQIERKAKDDEQKAKKAADVVNDAVSSMNPQRQYKEDKSQDTR